MSSNDKKIKILSLLEDMTLEATEGATQAYADRTILQSYESDQLNLSIKYTTGAAEAATTCLIKVYGYVEYDDKKSEWDLPDESGWQQLGGYVLSGVGTASFVPFTFAVPGGIGATEYTAHFAQGITFTKLMVTATETGVVANKGEVNITALIQ